MSWNIQTGTVVAQAAAPITTTANPMDMPGTRVLYRPGGRDLRTPPLHLGPDDVMWISAFNIPQGEYIRILRVVMQPGAMPQADPCGSCDNCLPSPGPTILPHSKPVLNCGNEVRLTASVDEITLTGPATYQFEASSMALLAQAYVEGHYGTS